jgi:hypothetical protein
MRYTVKVPAKLADLCESEPVKVNAFKAMLWPKAKSLGATYLEAKCEGDSVLIESDSQEFAQDIYSMFAAMIGVLIQKMQDSVKLSVSES